MGGLKGSGHLFPNSLLQGKKKVKGFISLETIADGRTLSLQAREVEAAPRTECRGLSSRPLFRPLLEFFGEAMLEVT